MAADDRAKACVLFGAALAAAIWTVGLAYDSIPCAILCASLAMGFAGSACAYARQSMRTLAVAMRWQEVERRRL